MRCYHFGNYYMSSIQQGIQAAHCQMELFVKYEKIDLYDYARNTNDSPPEHIIRRANLAGQLFNWSKNYKTMVCLNGGNNKDLLKIKELFTFNDTYPWSYFCEDEESLGGILTNLCIVLPEAIYDSAAKIRNREYTLQDNRVWDELGKFVVELTEFEVKLIALLNSCQLAK